LKPNYSPLKIPKVKIIGLTGNIASGKSAVGEMFKMLGATVIDADQAARSVVEPEKPAWKDIVDTFGSGALNPDGTIDREKLGEIVFNDEAKRKVLNDITHPRILEELN
jgi:dephospho-CoA kinase